MINYNSEIFFFLILISLLNERSEFYTMVYKLVVVEKGDPGTQPMGLVFRRLQMLLPGRRVWYRLRSCVVDFQIWNCGVLNLSETIDLLSVWLLLFRGSVVGFSHLNLPARLHLLPICSLNFWILWAWIFDILISESL